MSGAVFLSYASQDADAVQRIAEALRAAGVDVWFDRNELVGGDAWDAKIRGQIAGCALFVPVISSATQARLEGYFRLEWKIAAQRTQTMADERVFLLPVVIDGTRDAEAKVPAEFKAVQWTRLRSASYGGQARPELDEKVVRAFAVRVSKLLDSAVAGVADPGADANDRSKSLSPATRPPKSIPTWTWLVPTIVGVATSLALAIWQPWRGSRDSAQAARAATADRPAVSPARQLALRAQSLSIDKYNSTAADYAAAEGLLKQALELDANDGEIWAISSLLNTTIRTRGFDYDRRRRELARSHAERARTLAPDSIEALYALARWQRDDDPDPEVAIRSFREILQRDPVHSRAMLSLATLLTRLGRSDESLVLLKRAAEIPSARALATFQQFLVYLDRGRFAEAEQAVRASIATEPSSNSVSGLAMVLLSSRGAADEAIAALDLAPAGTRNEHRLVWISAFAFLCANQPERALEALRRVPADFIEDNWFYGPRAYWEGRANLAAGRAEAARLSFESALQVVEGRLKVEPTEPRLRLNRAELLAWLGRGAEARSELRAVIELQSARSSPPPWFVSPVKVYAVLGDAAASGPYLEQLLAPAEREGAGWPLTRALIRVDPLWAKIRSDPGIQAIVDGSGMASAMEATDQGAGIAK
ncbi:MAG TPA: TIR domain-containing protein [Opitutaceae bacterium]